MDNQYNRIPEEQGSGTPVEQKTDELRFREPDFENLMRSAEEFEQGRKAMDELVVRMGQVSRETLMAPFVI